MGGWFVLLSGAASASEVPPLESVPATCPPNRGARPAGAPVSALRGAAAGEVGVAGFGLAFPRSEGLTLRGVGVPKGGSGHPGS